MKRIQKGPTILLILMCLFLMSCQSATSKRANSGSSDQSSRIDITDRGNGGVNTNGAIADCNKFDKASAQLSGYLSSYFVSSDAIILELIRMQLDQIPPGVEVNTDEYIQIFRWKEEVNGSRVVDPSPVEFYFESRTTGDILNPDDPVTTISRNTLQNMVNMSNDTGVNINNFLDAHIIVLTEMDAQWDAIIIANYDTKRGSSATSYVEALLPAFWADPNNYAADHDAVSLQVLHPMYSYRNDGWTDSQYFAATEQFCAEML